MVIIQAYEHSGPWAAGGRSLDGALHGPVRADSCCRPHWPRDRRATLGLRGLHAAAAGGGPRYGVVAGTGRVLDAVENFRFDADVLGFLRENAVVDEPTLEWLASYRFGGDIWGYPEGEVYFPGSPILRVEGSFAECVLLETVILSILNHDSAIAAAASRMASAAGDRPLIEMGARRTHELAAVAAARAAYFGGFTTTSDLAAGFRYGIPTVGTSAHAFTLLHDQERVEAFQAQANSLGRGTTLLVDTYDVAEAVRMAVEVAGPELGAVRIDSGDLLLVAHRVRAAAGRAGREGHAHHRDLGPGRVRDRLAGGAPSTRTASVRSW